MTALRMLDLFSGIGGFSLAARWLGGFQTVQFVERDPYCQRILRKHWPDVPIHDDICTFNPEPGSADVVVGGFPCQDISNAGKQAGIKEGTRSGLFYELIRVVRLVGPRYIVLENVAAITSNGLDAVLGTLAEAGFDAEWACIPAADVGACHRRDRWWCVAYASGAGPQDSKQAGQRTNAAQAGTGLEPFAGGGAIDAADANHAGVEAPQAEQLAAGAEQYGELDAADAERWPVQRQRGSAVLAGAQGAGEVDGQQRQWDGDAIGRGGEDAPHPNHQRQQERQPAAIAGGPGWIGWGDAPQRLNPDWRSYLSEPVLCRGDDGLSGRVDRLRALGNAVVPQVAMVPLQRVLTLSQCDNP